MNIIFPEFSESDDNFRFERFLYSSGYLRVAGCDEAGRGSLAGPVVAACVVLPINCDHSVFVDSKILSHSQRLKLYNNLQKIDAACSIGIVSPQEIDEINILQGSLLAMKRAVQKLEGIDPDFILVDGKFSIPFSTNQAPLIKGESKSCSIGAASIVAKVTRDEIMVAYHHNYPVYNFIKNKGYPTKEHRLAIKENGICPIHRKTFKGVKEYAEQSTTTG